MMGAWVRAGTCGNTLEHPQTRESKWGACEGPWGREGTIPEVNQINIHG